MLGEEYFDYVLKPKLKPQGLARLKEAVAQGEKIVLVSQGLDHVMRPLAQYLGIEELIANRLEFCDGRATGRLLSPVIRPRQVLARLIGGNPDGRVAMDKLSRNLGNPPDALQSVIAQARRIVPPRTSPTVVFDPHKRFDKLSNARIAGGQERFADRLHWIHRQSLAGESASGNSQSWEGLFADPAPAFHDCPKPV